MRITGTTYISEIFHSASLNAYEACQVLTSRRTGLAARSCYEFDSGFVFQAVPKPHAQAENVDKMLDSLFFVDKITAACYVFDPMTMSVDEYNRGKRVYNFK